MEDTSFAMMMAQSIGALALVLAVFAIVVGLIKHFQHQVMPHQKGKMKVLQRLSLDSKNSVVEIQFGNQHYLLGVGSQGVQKIADIKAEEESQDVA